MGGISAKKCVHIRNVGRQVRVPRSAKYLFFRIGSAKYLFADKYKVFCADPQKGVSNSDDIGINSNKIVQCVQPFLAPLTRMVQIVSNFKTGFLNIFLKKA